jgi:Zn finger protein HypA/HybF involved in hydrogenase expression
MPDLIAISQGFNAIKAMTEIMKTMIGLRDSAKLLENTVKLNSEILSVQTALANAQAEQTTLVQTVSQLEKEIARLKTWEAEKKRYQLKDVALAVFAYEAKATALDGEPLHWICAKCYQHRVISILQRRQDHHPLEGQKTKAHCPECKTDLDVPSWPPTP